MLMNGNLLSPSQTIHAAAVSDDTNDDGMFGVVQLRKGQQPTQAIPCAGTDAHFAKPAPCTECGCAIRPTDEQAWQNHPRRHSHALSCAIACGASCDGVGGQPKKPKKSSRLENAKGADCEGVHVCATGMNGNAMAMPQERGRACVAKGVGCPAFLFASPASPHVRAERPHGAHVRRSGRNQECRPHMTNPPVVSRLLLFQRHDAFLPLLDPAGQCPNHRGPFALPAGVVSLNVEGHGSQFTFSGACPNMWRARVTTSCAVSSPTRPH